MDIKLYKYQRSPENLGDHQSKIFRIGLELLVSTLLEN